MISNKDLRISTNMNKNEKVKKFGLKPTLSTNSKILTLNSFLEVTSVPRIVSKKGIEKYTTR
tara:strand:- start:90 stop:275 length:186 start_codon:yes stop_codon:yes gene_type:complete